MATTPIDTGVVAVGGTAPDHAETRTDSCPQPRNGTRPRSGAHPVSGRRHPLRGALRNTGIVLDTAWRVVLLGDEGMKAR